VLDGEVVKVLIDNLKLKKYLLRRQKYLCLVMNPKNQNNHHQI
jgi:hypothetical protein